MQLYTCSYFLFLGMWAYRLTVQDYQDLIDRGFRRLVPFHKLCICSHIPSLSSCPLAAAAISCTSLRCAARAVRCTRSGTAWRTSSRAARIGAFSSGWPTSSTPARGRDLGASEATTPLPETRRRLANPKRLLEVRRKYRLTAIGLVRFLRRLRCGDWVIVFDRLEAGDSDKIAVESSLCALSFDPVFNLEQLWATILCIVYWFSFHTKRIYA